MQNRLVPGRSKCFVRISKVLSFSKKYQIKCTNCFYPSEYTPTVCDEIHGKTIVDDKLCANATFWNQFDCGGPNCGRGSPYYPPCERCQGRYSGECVAASHADHTEFGDVE